MQPYTSHPAPPPSPPPPPPEVHPKRRRPLWRRIVRGCLITAVILFVVFALTWISYSAWTHRQLNRERQLVIDAGEPLDWNAFYKQFPPDDEEAPPPSEDDEWDFEFPIWILPDQPQGAGPYYSAAFELRHTLDVTDSSVQDEIMLKAVRGETPLTAEAEHRVREWLAERELMFELLDRAAAVDSCWYRMPRMGGTSMANFSGFRALANDLATRTQWQVYHDDGDAAVDTIIAILRLNRVLDSEPYLTAYMTEHVVDMMAMEEVQRLPALRTPPSQAALDRLAEALRAVDVERLERALIGERIWWIAQLEGPDGNGIVSDWFFGDYDERIPMPPPMRRHHEAVVMRDFRELMEAVRQPDGAGPFSASSNLVASDDVLLLRIENQNMAITHAARGVVAIELFRHHVRRGEAPPADWQQLVNARLLDAAPLDPFTGEPMKLRVDDRGYMIYSVGADGVDDGGDVTPPGQRQSSRDVGLTVRLHVEE